MAKKHLWFHKGLRTALAFILSAQMAFGTSMPVKAADTVSLEKEAADGGLVLDAAWEVENQNDNLSVNADGSITIRTEQGTIGGETMQNVLYQKLPNNTDYNFTVKVNGNFAVNYQGAFLMIASGKNLENVVGVVRRYHGYLGGRYGTNMLMGVMQNGNPAEYYTGAADIGNEFYLRLQKNNGRITGYYAEEYSENSADWRQIIEGNYAYVDKGQGLVNPSDIYIAIGAGNGSGSTATDVTFSDLKIDGNPVAFTMDADAFHTLSLTGADQIGVGEEAALSIVGYNADQTVSFTEFERVAYTSSDEDVATVDENGVVTGKSVGVVQIMAEATVNGVTRTTAKTIQIGEVAVEQDWSVVSPDGRTTLTAMLMNCHSFRFSGGDCDKSG